MRGQTLLPTLLVVFVASCVAQAQPAGAASGSAEQRAFDASEALYVGASEWMATFGTAWGISLFHSDRGHDYVVQTLSWGKILTRPKFSGALRGRFEWAVEAMPLFGQYRPNGVYGFGLSPFSWRWNFEPHGKYAPFTELAGGLLWTSAPVPARTAKANFMAHAGSGVRIMIRTNQAIVLAYRFDHISNGNRFENNPGINAQAIHVGWSLMQGRR